ncbi:MAG: hypothetical protein H6Q38_3258, partial [Chloroflexi bacterium]|nr:hypothetical protein [Chloroflexota bacterium]
GIVFYQPKFSILVTACWHSCLYKPLVEGSSPPTLTNSPANLSILSTVMAATTLTVVARGLGDNQGHFDSVA